MFSNVEAVISNASSCHNNRTLLGHLVPLVVGSVKSWLSGYLVTMGGGNRGLSLRSEAAVKQHAHRKTSVCIKNDVQLIEAAMWKHLIQNSLEKQKNYENF